MVAGNQERTGAGRVTNSGAGGTFPLEFYPVSPGIATTELAPLRSSIERGEHGLRLIRLPFRWERIQPRDQFRRAAPQLETLLRRGS